MTKNIKKLCFVAVVLVTAPLFGFFSVANAQSGGSAPTVTASYADNIGQNSATLNASVNSNGSGGNYFFLFGTTEDLGIYSSIKLLSDYPYSQNVAIQLSQLPKNTTYYARIRVGNSYGTVLGSIFSFTTGNSGGGGSGGGGGGGGGSGSAPVATTNYVSNLTQTSATLNGAINPNGSNANYWFEYGQTSALGQLTARQYLGNYSYPQNVSAQIYNLSPNTNYYYRVSVQNSYGEVSGSIYNFMTNNSGIGGGGGGGVYGCNVGNYSGSNNNSGGYNYNYSSNSAPCVQTLAPANLTDTGAAFNGQVTTGSGANSVMGWFEYGINASSMFNTTNNISIPSNVSNYNFSNFSSSLSPGTTYYVRAVARNSYGTSYGQTYQFATTNNGGGNSGAGGLPSATTKDASYVAANSALFNGSVNPNGGLGNGWFEYGTAVSLGMKSVSQPVGAGTNPANIAYAINYLLPNTTYYFRTAVQTQFGTSYGSILNFRTNGATPANPPVNPPVVPGALPATVDNPQDFGDSSCLKLLPALSAREVHAGEEFNYILSYRNECGYNLSNASLVVTLPSGTSFVPGNGADASYKANTATYNLGSVAEGYEGKVEIKNHVDDKAEKGSALLYGST
ncbi:MAG: fibronectin type III domain-containing protein, partial [Candidatus Liptonbacteria bacterium]|nr:fibronectin type III domain-containing protein [Candidatus Liptonbacteria bacterium]